MTMPRVQIHSAFLRTKNLSIPNTLSAKPSSFHPQDKSSEVNNFEWNYERNIRKKCSVSIGRAKRTTK